MSAKPINRTWVGSGAAAIALLTIAQTQLGDLNLQLLVKWLVIAWLGVLVALITANASAHTARRTTEKEEEVLEAALAGGVLRVKDRKPFDLGVQPGPNVAYVGRTEDAELDEALATDEHGNAAMILLVGPANAGKTRTACEAISRTLPEAMLLAPVDGLAVNTLLAQRETFRLDSTMQAVLWLDSLERYFDKLDLDALDEMLFLTDADPEASGPISNFMLKTRRASRRLLASTLKRPRSPFASERQGRRQVAVVATIRDNVLQTALAGEDAVAQTARRLVARMRIVSIPPRPHNPAPLPTTPHEASFEPTAFEKPPTPTDGRGLLVILACLLVAIAGGLYIAVKKEGWKIPPALSSQVADLENELEACQHFEESPRAKELTDKSPWILAVSNKDCPGSDKVRYFTVVNKRLKEQFNETPQSSERWEFSCLAPGPSTCLTPVPGIRGATLGAFSNAGNGNILPLVLYRSGKALRLFAPFLSPPSARHRRASNGHILTLKLYPGAASSAEAKPKPSCRHPAQLCSHPLEFLTALPQPGAHPLLIIGTVTSGTAINPERILLKTLALEYAQGKLQIDPRECLFYRHGTQVRSKREIKVKESVGTPEAQVRKYWTARPEKHEAVIC